MSTLGNEQNLSIRHAAAPLTVFLSQEAISCSRRHSNIIMFILKYFHCVIESTLGICLSPLSATSTSNLFASCHQPSVPAVFTELSNRYDMFWLQIKFFSSHWRPRTEKLAVLSSSAAIGLWPCDSHRRANWSCSCIWAFYIFMSCSETKVQNSLNFNFKPRLY